jgi:tetrahydrodipicolinate N-succinyltransferase
MARCGWPNRGPDGLWHVNQWAKKAVLLGFRLHPMAVQEGGPQGGTWWDKVDSKFAGWDRDRWQAAGFRAVPNCVVRKGAHIAPGVVLMPCFVNIGAHVGAGTMIDTWATVGSCAQIGRNVHLSGGAGIGGVLEPMQATPTIIEDDCFIGARSEVVEGVIVRRGAVIGMGVFIGQSTKIVDRATGDGELWRGAALCGGGRRLDAVLGRRASELRGDRQAGRRADPVEDRDQRVAARLTAARPGRCARAPASGIGRVAGAAPAGTKQGRAPIGEARMRVLAIAATKAGQYGSVFADSVLRALGRLGAKVTTIGVAEDVRAHPGHDAYLGLGDELLWRNPQIVAGIRSMGGRCADFRAAT